MEKYTKVAIDITEIKENIITGSDGNDAWENDMFDDEEGNGNGEGSGNE